MKAGLNSPPFSGEIRHAEGYPIPFIRANLCETILRFAQKNEWWIITVLGANTILLEMCEHLKLFQYPDLFFYGEVSLITVLLIFAGLAKTSLAVQSSANPRTKVNSHPIEALLPQQLMEEKIRAVQNEIARDLHDTLGQNISYLRMRLEYLAENGMSSITDLKVDLRHMTEVANESYDLIRGTLSALQAKASNGLYSLLAGHARQVAERTSVQIDIREMGYARQLPINYLLQIFFIFREATYNIEKHACASHASVDIEWSEAGLSLRISDNGCGFDPVNFEQSNHYGLRFIRERTERLNGIFSIDSVRGAGTTIVIRLHGA